jgi:hypothetical protein
MLAAERPSYGFSFLAFAGASCLAAFRGALLESPYALLRLRNGAQAADAGKKGRQGNGIYFDFETIPSIDLMEGKPALAEG